MYALNAIHFTPANKKYLILQDVLISSAKNTAENNISTTYQNLAFAGFWLLLCFTPPSYAINCSSDHIDQYATVKHVYDGDTIQLHDGKKIRLIGINTPEMNYKSNRPEPYAKKAKSFLKRHLLKQRIGLRYGLNKRDRYGRLLAHVFINDLNIQRELLINGLGVNITFPPNLWGDHCYLAAEKKARREKKGVWKKHHQRIVNAQRIKPSQTGFQFVKGTVKSVHKNNKRIRLNLSNNVAIQIYKKNWHYFNDINLEQLSTKRVIARGWVNTHKKRYFLTINHPNALQLL